MRALQPVALLAAIASTVVGCHRVAPSLGGTSARHLVVGGVTRTYLMHVGGPAKVGRPLVLVLHGLTGSGAAIQSRTRGTFDRLADRDGAVVVYPDALGDPHRWSEGYPPGAGPPPPDDVGFLSALIDALVADVGVDRKRVFAAGISNGAAMVYRLACERPDLVAGVAPVAGYIRFEVARTCARGAAVSVIAMHGTEDPIAPMEQWVREGVAMWEKRDGCPAQPASSRLPDTDPSDGTQTRVDLFAPCADGAAVAFYTIEGGGHAWPGGTSPWGWVKRGRTPSDFDAAEVIWDFFQRHPRP